MAITSRSLLFVFSIILAFSNEVVGRTPLVDRMDRNVLKVAEFAITERNRLAKTHLIMVYVINVYRAQTRSAIMYDLTISAKDGDAASAKNYLAVVWDMKVGNKMILKSFKEKK
ncbi:cysteine proteinase inhibitor 5 [Phtheirospermum japonicum]|uniref:Cysteine proteinase inhibitor 5 n=1 Tax=Phtheirospermum japonicum TaxID=374723 RepID=A0A830CJD2_9LAMI|nr:cysteine proteinase inhibitor 5 [Phtheirospermum japonicum]